MEQSIQSLFGLSEQNSSYIFYGLLAVGVYLLLQYFTTPRLSKKERRPVPRSSSERPPRKSIRINKRKHPIEKPKIPTGSTHADDYKAPDDYYSGAPQGPLAGPRDDVDYRAPSNRRADPSQTGDEGEGFNRKGLTGLQKFMMIAGLMFLMATTGYGGYIPLLFLGALFFMGRGGRSAGGLGGLIKKTLGSRGFIVILGYILRLLTRRMR